MFRVLVTVVWLAALLTATHAQTYPDRTIKLVVGFPAGGPTDGPARIVAEKLRASLGQPVVVENRPGAGGKIAVDYILGQPRDGYTLLLCTYIDAINTVLYKKSSYQLADLAAVSLITNAFYAVAVENDVPANNINEFIAYAKKKPGELNYGHVGAGSAPELVAAAPEIPTLKEQGVPIVAGTWLGVCAANGTPQSVIALLNKRVAEAVASDDYKTLMTRTGVVGVSSTPEKMTAEMKTTADDAADLIKALGLQRD